MAWERRSSGRLPSEGVSDGQSSDTIPTIPSSTAGVACGIRHRRRWSRHRLESRRDFGLPSNDRRSVPMGVIDQRVEAADRMRTSFGGRTIITRSGGSPRCRRSRSPRWIRRLSRGSKAAPSTTTASSEGVWIADSRHHRLDARSSPAGSTNRDRSINRASNRSGTSRSVSAVAWSKAEAPVSSTRRSSRLATRFQGPGRQRRPIQAMPGAGLPRSSCMFRRR